MKSKKLPIIITTREALDKALPLELSVIYIDEELYSLVREIDDRLNKQGYIAAEKKGKHGVFFFKSNGCNVFDPAVHEIYDPLGIL